MMRLLLSLMLLALAPVSAPAAAPKPPVVVELYTAQGCSSCRAANDHLAQLADQPGVLALTFAVDYWDYLGWPDTFAQPLFAERQRAYAKTMAIREVYTPQVVVNGRYQTGGVRSDQVDELVAKAAADARNPPDMLFMVNGKVAVGSGPVPRGGAEVWLVRFDPRQIEVTPRRGDNRGETLVHRNVVRQMVRLGGWYGRPTAFRLPKAEEEGLKTAVIVQGARGGRIIGVLVEPGGQ
jgi:hypothetical protein